MIRKAVVSHYLHVPYVGMEEKLSIEEIDKLYYLSLHLFDIMEMAPFKLKNSK